MRSFLEILSALLTIAVSVFAQIYRVQRDRAHEWIDEIIEALENKDEAAGDVAVDGLLDRAGK